MLLSRHIKRRVHLNRDMFKDYAMPQIRDIIEQHVSDYFEQPIEKIRMRSRRRIYVLPRQIMMYLLEYYTDYSLLQIGGFYNKKDHSTPIHAKRTIEGFITQRASTPEKQQVNTFLYRYGYKIIEEAVTEPPKAFVIDAHY